MFGCMAQISGVRCTVPQHGEKHSYPALLPGREPLDLRETIQRQTAVTIPPQSKMKLAPRKLHFSTVNTGARTSTTAVCCG